MSQWAPTMELHNHVYSAAVTPGLHFAYIIHLDVQDCEADTAYMLVDLSDTVNWPHPATTNIHLEAVDVHINPDDSYTGDIQVGFLRNVDAANGDLYVLHCWHFEKNRVTMMDHLDFAWRQVHCEPDSWFGPIVANNVLFQTDVNLQGPDGNVAYPSGDGDVVLRINRTAGTLDLGITVSYQIHED